MNRAADSASRDWPLACTIARRAAAARIPLSPSVRGSGSGSAGASSDAGRRARFATMGRLDRQTSSALAAPRARPRAGDRADLARVELADRARALCSEPARARVPRPGAAEPARRARRWQRADHELRAAAARPRELRRSVRSEVRDAGDRRGAGDQERRPAPARCPVHAAPIALRARRRESTCDLWRLFGLSRPDYSAASRAFAAFAVRSSATDAERGQRCARGPPFSCAAPGRFSPTSSARGVHIIGFASEQRSMIRRPTRLRWASSPHRTQSSILAAPRRADALRQLAAPRLVLAILGSSLAVHSFCSCSTNPRAVIARSFSLHEPRGCSAGLADARSTALPRRLHPFSSARAWWSAFRRGERRVF